MKTIKKNIGIVGSRNASPQHNKLARDFGRFCARKGITVVSGGARGIDSSAMAGALDGGGKVLLYPPTGVNIARQVWPMSSVEIVSDLSPDAGWNMQYAFKRNMYIYMSSICTLVVESTVGHGGTWSGAIEALDRGDMVFVWEECAAAQALKARGAKIISVEGLKEMLS